MPFSVSRYKYIFVTTGFPLSVCPFLHCYTCCICEHQSAKVALNGLSSVRLHKIIFLMVVFVFSRFCHPPFRRKAERHSFWLSVLPSVFPSFRPPKVQFTLCTRLLLQFSADSFETLQMFSSWSEDMYVVWILS